MNRLFPHGTNTIQCDLSDRWTWAEVKPFLWILLAVFIVGALQRWDHANPQKSPEKAYEELTK